MKIIKKTPQGNLRAMPVNRTDAGSSIENALDTGLRHELICFSHLRWDFIYQRPQHLLTRCAKDRRVFFVEEPVFDVTTPCLEVTKRTEDVWIVVPHLPSGLTEADSLAIQQALLIDDLLIQHQITEYILWYYTPMALAFTEHLEPLAVVYDCMDELSGFKNAPPGLLKWERRLFERADLVFTGGYTLYEAKQHCHGAIHPFPSSIDGDHFRSARSLKGEPADQAELPGPRLGYYGAVDERIDLGLIEQIAQLRPEWHQIIVGPVVKIDPKELPRFPNIHYLGHKSYETLPSYLGGWDIAMMPFAHNEATRFISPTKTPEYLAAGVPVISTSIRDVVRPYGQLGLVQIADTAEDFVKAAEYLMSSDFARAQWLRQVDEALACQSWDRTWARMNQLLNATLKLRCSKELTRGSSPRERVRVSEGALIARQAMGD